MLSFLPWWLLGDQSRHLKYNKGGQDSRDYHYEKEFEKAVAALKRGDRSHNEADCVEAAKAFGTGLHSRQDRSAHRPWPSNFGGRNWHHTVSHPGWWDAFEDADLYKAYPNDKWWGRFSEGPDYDSWRGTIEQWESQSRARESVVSDSKAAISAFVDEINNTCFCKRKMLKN